MLVLTCIYSKMNTASINNGLTVTYQSFAASAQRPTGTYRRPTRTRCRVTCGRVHRDIVP